MIRSHRVVLGFALGAAFVEASDCRRHDSARRHATPTATATATATASAPIWARSLQGSVTLTYDGNQQWMACASVGFDALKARVTGPCDQPDPHTARLAQAGLLPDGLVQLQLRLAECSLRALGAGPPPCPHSEHYAWRISSAGIDTRGAVLPADCHDAVVNAVRALALAPGAFVISVDMPDTRYLPDVDASCAEFRGRLRETDGSK